MTYEQQIIDALKKALSFYADPKRYQGPNLRLDESAPDEFQPMSCPYLWDVTRDGGDIARKALSELKVDDSFARSWLRE